MKKLLSVLFVLLMVLFVVSCSGGGDDASDTDALSGTESSADTEAPIVEKCDYTYEIVEEIVTVHETEDGRKSMKVLRYPKISGMTDAELESSVNATFAEIAAKQYTVNVPDAEIYIIEEVEVTFLSNSFISVKNTVYSMTAMDNYPNCPVYTVNIDLTNGNVIEEDDIFGDFNVITSGFLAGDYTMVYGADDLMDNTNYEDMILQYKSDYASYPDVYFTEDSLVICIDLVASLGTSAGFSVPISAVADSLDFNPIK